MSHSILVAASEPRVGHGLVSSIHELGRAVAGPFTSNMEALDWLGIGRVDSAILDILLEDGSALQLADALHRTRVPLRVLCRLRRSSEGDPLRVPWQLGGVPGS